MRFFAIADERESMAFELFVRRENADLLLEAVRGDYEELGGTLWLEPVNLTRELERAASADRQPSLSARAIVVPARIQSAGFAVATGLLIAFGVLGSSTA